MTRGGSAAAAFLEDDAEYLAMLDRDGSEPLGASEEPPYYWFSDLRKNPDLLRPPSMVIPRLAWQGRATLLAAPEKSGKSTLITQGLVEGFFGREFLGASVMLPKALWLALDEPMGDLVRRTEAFAPSDLPLAIMDHLPPRDQLANILTELRPSCLVVDCLSAFAAGSVDNFKDPEQWRQLFSGFLLPLIRELGTAAILVHHTTREGTRYADSREIGAAVDFILEVEPVPGEPTRRKVKGKGRGYPADWASYVIDYQQGRYDLAEGVVALDTRILRVIEGEPEIGLRRLRERVSGRNDEIDVAVKSLIQAGLVRNQGSTTAHRYITVPQGGQS